MFLVPLGSVLLHGSNGEVNPVSIRGWREATRVTTVPALAHTEPAASWAHGTLLAEWDQACSMGCAQAGQGSPLHGGRGLKDMLWCFREPFWACHTPGWWGGRLTQCSFANLMAKGYVLWTRQYWSVSVCQMWTKPEGGREPRCRWNKSQLKPLKFSNFCSQYLVLLKHRKCSSAMLVVHWVI